MPIDHSVVQFEEKAGGNVVEIHLTDTLTKGDYTKFVPEMERLIQEHGRLRLIVDMHEFRGWTVAALWHDLKFDLKHFRDVERIAMIGETQWQKWMASFCTPFTRAKIRYFTHEHADEARAWAAEDLPAPAAKE